MKIKQFIPLFFLSAFFTACDNRPSHVLSDRKMEDVLFDVYIAQAEIDNNYAAFSDSARKADLLKTVLKSHKINKAVFDTSLVWYSDNLERYIKVNEKIIKRYAKMAENLKAQHSEDPEMLALEELGIQYPVNGKDFFLRKENLPQNVYAFEADTTLLEDNGDYALRFNVLGLPSKIRPVVTFCVQCQDTMIVRRDTIQKNGLFTMSVQVFSPKQVNRFSGSIYFPETNSDMNLFINRLSIYKKMKDTEAPEMQTPGDVRRLDMKR